MKTSIYLLTLFLISFSNEVKAQLCQGNKGLNIFFEGDFGTGSTTIIPTDPNIAPGYNYTTQLPDDGQYSILNNTAVWNLYSAWFPLEDNSDDPNGYMMVVNASFGPGVFYEKEIVDVCGNTQYEFSADIINLIRSGTANHIDPVVEFLIDGVPQFSTGQVPKNEQWNKYGFTFTTPPNTNSITLTLRNNAPGGYGNDLALDNISFQPCGSSAFVGLDPTKSVLLCVDDDPFELTADIENGINNVTVQWQYSTDSLIWVDVGSLNDLIYIHDDFTIGEYYYRYLSAGDEMAILNEKCRIISDVVNIKILPLEYYIQDTVCNGAVYLFGDLALNKEGMFVDTFNSSRGCDSIVYLDLSIIDDPQLAFITEFVGPACAYLNEGELTITGIENAFYPVEITLGDEKVFLNEPKILLVGSYQVKAVDRFSCEVNSLVEVVSPPTFELEVPDSVAMRYGDCMLIEATSDQEITSISWLPIAAFDDPNIEEVVFTPFASGIIQVVAFNENDCVDSTSIVVTLSDKDEIVFPNVFSPNGDGVNDDLIFRPYGKSILNIISFSVFDRYGNKIIQKQNLASTGEILLWANNEVKVNPGVYVGFLEFVSLDGQNVNQIFDITILR